jgi:sulfur-oxidizing protein SoxY
MTRTDIEFSANRRLILQGAGAVALVGLGNLAFGLAPAFAAANDKYPEEAFKAKSDADAIKALYGKTAEASDKVKMDAPEIAENGAVVPMVVGSSLPGVKHILLLVEKNPNALVAKFDVSDALEPSFSTRAKMGQTSDVYAVAITGDGKAYYAKKEVKVTLGGCGG